MDVVAPAGLKTRDKALVALNLRRRGMGLKKIGDHFGVCLERARQLVVQGHQIEIELKSQDPQFQLSNRVRNALEQDGCRPITPEHVSDYYIDLRTIRRVPNLGRLSITEIQEWLTRHNATPLLD